MTKYKENIKARETGNVSRLCLALSMANKPPILL